MDADLYVCVSAVNKDFRTLFLCSCVAIIVS